MKRLIEIEEFSKRYSLNAETKFTLTILSIIEINQVTYEQLLKSIIDNPENYKFLI